MPPIQLAYGLQYPNVSPVGEFALLPPLRKYRSPAFFESPIDSRLARVKLIFLCPDRHQVKQQKPAQTRLLTHGLTPRYLNKCGVEEAILPLIFLNKFAVPLLSAGKKPPKRTLLFLEVCSTHDKPHTALPIWHVPPRKHGTHSDERAFLPVFLPWAFSVLTFFVFVHIFIF